MRAILRETEWQTRQRGGQRAAEDEDPMARALVVELPGQPIGLLAFVLVGEAALLTARMGEEAHQVAARQA